MHAYMCIQCHAVYENHKLMATEAWNHSLIISVSFFELVGYSFPISIKHKFMQESLHTKLMIIIEIKDKHGAYTHLIIKLVKILLYISGESIK